MTNIDDVLAHGAAPPLPGMPHATDDAGTLVRRPVLGHDQGPVEVQ